MTIIKAQQITDDNIKCRWEEPYVSSAINRQLSAFPRGVYRGFKVEEMSPPGSGVSISPDSYPDSYLLHENLATGFKTAVRYDAAFDVDDLATAVGFVNGVDHYIWVDVTYLVSSASSGYIRVGNAADLAAAVNAVPIASFNVAAGTTISNADISQSPTSSPVEFLTPVPNTAESNFWGLLDQTRFDRLPNQNQKNAMDAANAPTTGNPFATIADAPTDIPFTYVVTDGVRSTGGDFDGPTALYDCLVAVNASNVGADIYVRLGEYTLAVSLWVGEKVRIFCEGWGEGGGVGRRCQLTMSHAANAGLIFEQNIEIKGLAITTTISSQSISTEDQYILEGCDIDGEIEFAVGSECRVVDCSFDNTVTIQNCATVEFLQCTWRILTGGYCMQLDGVRDLRVINCYMDGCDRFGGFPYEDGGGIGSGTGVTLSNVVIESLEVYCATNHSGVHLNSTGPVEGIQVRGLHIIEMYQMVSVPTFEIGQSDDSVLEVSNVVLEKDHNQPPRDGTFAWVPGDDLVNAVASFRNIKVLGSDGIFTGANNMATGLVMFQAHGALRNVQVRVENLSISGVRPSIFAPAAGVLLSVGLETVHASGFDVGITFDGLNISNLNTTTLTANSYMFGVVIATPGNESGSVTIQNSIISGFGLDDTTYGHGFGGLRMFEETIREPNQLVIRDSTITDWYAHDIYINDCSLNLLIDGLSNHGNVKNDGDNAGARVWLNNNTLDGLRIVNCHYKGHDLVAFDTWLYLDPDTAAVNYPSICNNYIDMGNGSKVTFYLDDGVYKAMLFANGGLGYLTYLGGDDPFGVGDATVGDNMTNQMGEAPR
jgi:hypothetical protein